MKEALKLALEALEKYCTPYNDNTHPADDTITAIKEALAQPAQEPVAWMDMVVANLVREGVNKHKARELAQHFYPAPQQRPWVGLTDEEVDSLQRLAIDPVEASGWGFLNRERYARLIEVKLKEKNT